MAVELIYWDSDAFLGWFQAEPGKEPVCRATIERAQRGEVLLVTSTLTLAEVLWMRGAPRLSKDKAELVQKFFRRSYIRVRNVTRNVAETAQGLVWDNSIAPKDAVHVATAIEGKIPVLETFDAKLIGKSGRVGAPPLMIRQPLPAVQGTLDLGHV